MWRDRSNRDSIQAFIRGGPPDHALIYGQGPLSRGWRTRLRWVFRGAKKPLRPPLPIHLLTTSSFLTFSPCSCRWYVNKRNGVIRLELCVIVSPTPCTHLHYLYQVFCLAVNLECPCSCQIQEHHPFVPWTIPFLFVFSKLCFYSSPSFLLYHHFI